MQFCPTGSIRQASGLKVPIGNFHDCGHSHCAVRRTKWDLGLGSALCQGPIANSHSCATADQAHGWLSVFVLFFCLFLMISHVVSLVFIIRTQISLISV